MKALTSGNNYYFGTKFLLWFNASNVLGRRLIFVKSPTPSWRYTLTDSQMRLNFSTPQTNYRIIYFPTFSLGTVIRRISDAFAAMESIVNAHDTTQPLSYLSMFNSYHSQISSREPEASWRILYEGTQTSKVKLIGHNLPEKVVITAWRYVANQLTATITAPNKTTSITKVYVGDKGEPTAVYALNGTLFWSYNSSTTMIELRVTHLGPAEIMVDWRMPGDVNADGVVDILDAAKISAHWYPGPPIGPLGYDPIADINYDEAVDILDAGIVSAHWTGPPKGPQDP